MLTVEAALEKVRDACGEPRLRTERVPITDAGGRVLAADVSMDHDVPPFRRATMDGFAVRAAERAVGATFAVRGAVMAGEVSELGVGAGEALRIMTGAPVPEGADAVIPFEWMDDDGDTATLARLPSDKDNIVQPGEHARTGDVLVQAGTALGPGDLGALASAGCADVPVAARPRVAILGTGSELVPVDAAPGPGRIRNSNGAALCGQVERAGAEALDLGFVVDDETRLRDAVRRGLDADVFLLSGGVSKGDLDLVPGALEAEGVRPIFHRWAVQPGGPLWFGATDTCLVFGLPGNPAATFVGFEILVQPALRTRVGLALEARAAFDADYDGPWGKTSPKRRYRPVRLGSDAGRLTATAVPWRGSGDPFALAAADALVAIPAGTDAPGEGPYTLPAIPTTAGALLWGRP